jgi:hypothetical protein
LYHKSLDRSFFFLIRGEPKPAPKGGSRLLWLNCHCEKSVIDHWWQNVFIISAPTALEKMDRDRNILLMNFMLV